MEEQGAFRWDGGKSGWERNVHDDEEVGADAGEVDAGDGGEEEYGQPGVGWGGVDVGVLLTWEG